MTARYLLDLTQSLEQLEKMTANALSSSEVGVWEWDLENDKIHWDTRMINLFEFSSDYHEIQYSSFQEVVLPEYHEIINTSLQNCINNRTPYFCIYKIKSTNANGFKTIMAKGQLVDTSDSTRILTGICTLVPDSLLK